ncbi:MAG TPA: DUF2254 family protein [Candidatus Aquilonibacter sp.]|nr:DUF2254 family protein [Candidatus Aquilonibacter sp.]
MKRSFALPVVVATAIVLASAFLPRLDILYLERPHVMSVASAQAFLSAIATGGIALTAIVFSIAFVVLQFTVGTYSPRLAPVLARDSVLVNALLVFIATFGYALGTLAATDSYGKDIVPAYSMIVVTVLLGASMVMLGRLIQRLGRLQIYQVLEYIGDRARANIAKRGHAVAGGDYGDGRPSGEPDQTVIYNGSMRYVTGIDRARLRSLLPGATVIAACSVGDAVTFGLPIARVYGAAPVLRQRDVLSAIRLSSERDLKTDLPYAFRLLVDTAVRALSPAINDPATAVETLDEIEDLLCRLSVRELDRGERWERYLELAFEEIREAARTQPTVLRRMRAALDSVERTARVASRKHDVHVFLTRIGETVADRQGIGVFVES